jgi:hypothetical protein
VSLIGESGLLSRCTERLAGATACPDLFIFGPSGEPQRKRPPADSGKEMALGVSCEVCASNINN